MSDAPICQVALHVPMPLKYFQSYTLYFILGRFVADINSAAEDPTQKVLQLTISGVK